MRIFNKNVADTRFAGRDEMLAAMREENPDIVCLQEYFSIKASPFGDHNQRMVEQVGLPHRAVWEAIVDRQGRMWGLGIFSRYPVLRQGSIDFPENVLNGCHWADIDAPGGVIRVFNLHFQSIQISHQVYSAGSAIDDMRDSGARNALLKKLLIAYRYRAAQGRSGGRCHCRESAPGVALRGLQRPSPELCLPQDARSPSGRLCGGRSRAGAQSCHLARGADRLHHAGYRLERSGLQAHRSGPSATIFPFWLNSSAEDVLMG